MPFHMAYNAIATAAAHHGGVRFHSCCACKGLHVLLLLAAEAPTTVLRLLLAHLRSSMVPTATAGSSGVYRK
jgi:hypothetical protein